MKRVESCAPQSHPSLLLSLFPTPSFAPRARRPRFPSCHSCLSIPFCLRPSQQILVAITDDLVITAKHLLDELNVYNDGDGRADHPLQAYFCQRLRDIFNEFIYSNDGDESGSTYRTKMQQLIDDVLSYKPPLRVYNSIVL